MKRILSVIISIFLLIWNPNLVYAAGQGELPSDCLEHSPDETWHSDESSHWHVCTACGEVVELASHNFDGGTCTVCGYKKSSGVTFTDVPATAYYYDAVYWALDKGITTGTSTGKFSPNAACTRGQVVTFLWRAAGCPEPESDECNFKDVKESSYCYKAVLWALEEGITNGTSYDTYSPNTKCTRGQVVTFLWRAAGLPEIYGDNPFTDVPSTAYYEKAVRWAVAAGITSGTGASKFSPNETCTRAQVVTFLYRAATQ